jgi:hypothetical protein
VSLLENNGEAPLLDSRFPDVSGKGRGYQLQSYGAGDCEDWPTLRKVSIWQTVNALEQVRFLSLCNCCERQLTAVGYFLSRSFARRRIPWRSPRWAEALRRRQRSTRTTAGR